MAVLLMGGAIAQNKGHKITFEISDITNETMLIAYHYGGKHYISDTLLINDKGVAHLEGNDALLNGVYLAVFPSKNNQYFEFLVSEQRFTIMTSAANMIEDITFEDSEENEIFYMDMKKMNGIRKQTDLIRKQLETADDDRKKTLQTQIDRINQKFREDRIALMEKYPDLFYTDLLGMLREVQVPDGPVDENGDLIDPNYTIKYYRDHYWEFTDFSEAGIIRTPVFAGKVNDFLDKFTSPEPDSLMKSCDIILNQAAANDDVFQTSVVMLLNKYANSKIMGHDGVYVHIVEEYYAKDRCWWTDPEQLEKLKERAASIKPTIIGQIAPDMIMRDTTTRVKFQLSQVPSDYTILYIWDPECGHCKKATPKLKTFFDAHKDDGIMVYAVTTNNIYEIEKWKDFIKEHNLNWLNVGDLYNETNFREMYDLSSTPQVLILDKDKKIIGKRLAIEQLENFFHNYMKFQEDDRYKNFSDAIPEVSPTDDVDDHSGHNH